MIKITEHLEFEQPGPAACINNDFKDLAPESIFENWYQKAHEILGETAYAFTLATVLDNRPFARMVYMREFQKEYLTFFTNYHSAKGKALAKNPNACAVFHWSLPVQRQVRICGKVKKIDRAASEAYFASRPRESQISAIISNQSEVIASREQLLNAYKVAETQYKNQEIPCPAHWGGYALYFESIEFWQGAAFRLHDRILYQKNEENQWNAKRLAP